MARRRVLRLGAAVALVRVMRLAGPAAAAGLAGLAGCGFQLRQPPQLAFGRLALVGFAPDSPLEAGLRRSLAGQVRFVDTPAEAEVVLRALAEVRERSIAASTAAGQVRELQLRLRVSVRADTPDGRVLMPPLAMRLVRELSTSETAALAKAGEEEALHRAMLADVVDQLTRRLAALQP
jgi:LPS-assembly lipoprotein